MGTGFAIMRSDSSAGSDLARAGVLGTEGLDRHAQIVDARAVGPAVDAGRQAVDRACEQTAGQPSDERSRRESRETRAAVGRGAQANSAISGGADAQKPGPGHTSPHIAAGAHGKVDFIAAVQRQDLQLTELANLGKHPGTRSTRTVGGAEGQRRQQASQHLSIALGGRLPDTVRVPCLKPGPHGRRTFSSEKTTPLPAFF